MKRLMHKTSLLSSLLALSLAVSIAAAADLTEAPATGPYFQDEDGKLSEIKTPAEKNKDKDWLGLRFNGKRASRVGVVVRVESELQTAYTQGVSGMLESALMTTGQFRMFDGAASQGKKSAPRYIVATQIVEYSPYKKGRSFGGIGGGLVGGMAGAVAGAASVNTAQAEIAIAVRIIEAASGEVLDNTVVRAKSGTTSFGFGAGGIGSTAGGAAGMGSWSNGAIAAAAQIAVNKATYHVYSWFQSSGEPTAANAR